MSNDNGITIGQLTEALNNKFDLPAGVPQDAIDYVVEFKRPTTDDPTWYRKYKSGWIEQGGQVLSLARGATSEVVFLIPFTNNNYALTFGTFGEGFNAGEANFRCTAYSETGATFYNNSGTITTYKWYACGQGA